MRINLRLIKTNHEMEIANAKEVEQIAQRGFWVEDDTGRKVFFPPHQILWIEIIKEE